MQGVIDQRDGGLRVREAWSPGRAGRELLLMKCPAAWHPSRDDAWKPPDKNTARQPGAFACLFCRGLPVNVEIASDCTMPGIDTPHRRGCLSLPDVTIEMLSINAQRQR
jgi:hypothetical protein